MRIDLSGRTAVVTGSTEGIGFASAAGLAAAGARVVVNGRKPDGVERAVATLREQASGADVIGVAADVGSPEGCAELVRQAPEADILVNNTGVYGPQPFFEIDDAEWERFFQVNVMSGVRLSRALMPGMLQRGWGRIVFVSSESGVNIPADMIHYGFTKTAMLSVSRGLAKLGAGKDVTVNAVLPGPTLTPGVSAMLESAAKEAGTSVEEAGAAFVKAHRSNSIIGRLASPEEVANMIVYACSPQASATTGAALRVEGGILEGFS
ncbi:SDR family NAD(P)-dependent oxidoreductase [uncultured Enterovirga sp.]|uniref:SDR family NAD(P)-dependent oxidoreductase n=1 Tax=uncultured Enterovirga sp. TaxID=2026352 RepID=UPI0035C9F1F6